MAQDYTFATSNKRAADAARKDCIFEQIGAVIESRSLKPKDLQRIIPELTPKQCGHIRQGLRSAASIERLERLAKGLGILSPTYDPCAVAA